MIDLDLRTDLDGLPQNLPYWGLCQNAIDFVYFIQGHRFNGIDVVVWRMLRDGEFVQFVAATGPIMLGPVVRHSQSDSPNSEGQISLEDRVRWRLRGVTPQRIWNAIDRTACVQVHTSASIQKSTFQEVCDIAVSIQQGCQDLLGSERIVRVIAHCHGTDIDASSFDGNEDPNVIFKGINNLLMIAGIQNLPVQQIPIYMED